MASYEASSLLCSTSAEGNAAALKAGTDYNCESYADLRLSYLEGLVTRSDIERAASRVLEHKFRLGVMDPPSRNPFADIPATIIGSPHHLLKTTEAAQKGELNLCMKEYAIQGTRKEGYLRWGRIA